MLSQLHQFKPGGGKREEQSKKGKEQNSGPGNILKISGFTNNNWSRCHHIAHHLTIGFTEQLLYLIKSLQRK